MRSRLKASLKIGKEKKGMEGRRMKGEKWRQDGRGLVLVGPSQ